MSAVTNTFENVKAVILSAHENSTTEEKLNFYNSWAQNYDQVWEMKWQKDTTSGNILVFVWNMKWKFLHLLLWFNRMWPSWTTVHLAWQQTLFQNTSTSTVMQQSCWTSPVVQEWCPKRYIHEITEKKNPGHSHSRIFKNQFQTLLRTRIFILHHFSWPFSIKAFVWPVHSLTFVF